MNNGRERLRSAPRCRILPILALVITALISGNRLAEMPARAQTAPQIDWVNFVKFNGIFYVDYCGQTTPSACRELGHLPLARHPGPRFATVTFKVDGNVEDSAYRAKDGDAAYLMVGTPVYAISGYQPWFRLGAYLNGRFILFEAISNPRARVGGDLLDVRGKVRSIEITSALDGATPLGCIQTRRQVNALVALLLRAPVEAAYMPDGPRQFLVLHLKDHTVTRHALYTRADYVTPPGIRVPRRFVRAIRDAKRDRPRSAC